MWIPVLMHMQCASTELLPRFSVGCCFIRQQFSPMYFIWWISLWHLCLYLLEFFKRLM